MAGAPLLPQPGPREPVPNAGPRTPRWAASGWTRAADTPSDTPESWSFQPPAAALSLKAAPAPLAPSAGLSGLNAGVSFLFGPKPCEDSSLLEQAGQSAGQPLIHPEQLADGRPVAQQECAGHPEPPGGRRHGTLSRLPAARWGAGRDVLQKQGPRGGRDTVAHPSQGIGHCPRPQVPRFPPLPRPPLSFLRSAAGTIEHLSLWAPGRVSLP